MFIERSRYSRFLKVLEKGSFLICLGSKSLILFLLIFSFLKVVSRYKDLNGNLSILLLDKSSVFNLTPVASHYAYELFWSNRILSRSLIKFPESDRYFNEPDNWRGEKFSRWHLSSLSFSRNLIFGSSCWNRFWGSSFSSWRINYVAFWSDKIFFFYASLLLTLLAKS